MPAKRKSVMPKPVLAAGRRRQKGKGVFDWVKKGVNWFRDNVTKPSNLTKYIPGAAGTLITKGLQSKGYGRKRKSGGARKGVKMGGGGKTIGMVSM